MHKVRIRYTEWNFVCAQSKAREKKAKKESMNSHATRQMERSDCDGWLHVFVSDNNPLVRISIKHQHPHAPYEDIELPTKWQEFIKNNLDMSPAKVRVLYLITVLSVHCRSGLATYSYGRRYQRHQKYTSSVSPEVCLLSMAPGGPKSMALS